MLVSEEIFIVASSVSEAKELAALMASTPEVGGWYTFEDGSQLFIGKDWTSKVCVEARSGGYANRTIGRFYDR